MINKNNLTKSRELRKNMTPQERKLWSILKNRLFYNYRFRRQMPLGSYIVDFVCREKKIIIEIDGGQHNENIEYDITRTKELNALGYRVIRFWNNDIDKNFEGVYQELQNIFGVN